MSSSSSSRGADPVAPPAGRPGFDARRALLRALASAASLGLPALAGASVLADPGLKRWGRGEFRRFGFLVYEASLWAGDDPSRPPLALRLDYKRHIKASAIAEASVREMRRFVQDEGELRRWGEALSRIFPDVRPGDHIVGVYRSPGVQFYQDDRLIGTVSEPTFGEAFFAIWLDPRTSAPDLRAALLRRDEG